MFYVSHTLFITHLRTLECPVVYGTALADHPKHVKYNWVRFTMLLLFLYFSFMTKKASYVMKWDSYELKGLEAFTPCVWLVKPVSFRKHTPQAVMCSAYYHCQLLPPPQQTEPTHCQASPDPRPGPPWSFWRGACSSAAARCLPRV